MRGSGARVPFFFWSQDGEKFERTLRPRVAFYAMRPLTCKTLMELKGSVPFNKTCATQIFFCFYGSRDSAWARSSNAKMQPPKKSSSDRKRAERDD